MLFLLTDVPPKLKLEKIHGTLIIFFYVSSRSPWLQKTFFFYKKHTKKNSCSGPRAFKNQMQKTLGLVTIIGKRQSEAIKNFTVHILSTICVIIDESNKLNKNLSVISLELILSFLLYIGSDIETNSFTF